MNFTDEELEYMRDIDEMQGDGQGLLLYKGDPIAFEVGLNEYFAEKEFENEV